MMQILLIIHILAGTIALLSAIVAVLSEKGKKIQDRICFVNFISLDFIYYNHNL